MTIDQTGKSKLQALGYSALQAKLSVAGCAPFKSIPAKAVPAVCRHLQRQARHRISEEAGRESPLPDLPSGRQNCCLPPGIEDHLPSHRPPGFAISAATWARLRQDQAPLTRLHPAESWQHLPGDRAGKGGLLRQSAGHPTLKPASQSLPVDEGKDRNRPPFRGQVSVVSLLRRCGSLHFRERWRVRPLGGVSNSSSPLQGPVSAFEGGPNGLHSSGFVSRSCG